MLTINSVTLAVADTENHELAKRALLISMARYQFDRVVFFSDIKADGLDKNIEFVEIPRFSSRSDYSRFVVKELCQHISTTHVLLIQWDGFVVSPQAWNQDFLLFDYIGAPWGFHKDEFRVGNGGFSLRSKRLLSALQDDVFERFDPEDDVICRHYRPLLESKYSIKFAPESLASDFSFETTYPKGPTFGFHGLFNLWYVLGDRDMQGFVDAMSSRAVGSVQALQLAKNLAELKRVEMAFYLLKRRLTDFPNDLESARMLELLQGGTDSGSKRPSGSAGRNEICPCGSGKRFKHCCGLKSGAVVSKDVENKGRLDVALRMHQEGRLEEARKIYEALVARENNLTAKHYLGVILLQKGDANGAEGLIRAVIEESDQPPAEVYNNLGLVLRKQNRLEAAISAYRSAIEINRGYAPAWNNLGLDLQQLNFVGEAIEAFESAIKIAPNFPQAHYGLSLAHLLKGDFEHGWREYEWRIVCQDLKHYQLQLNDGNVRKYWQGEDLDGKTILIRTEQGIGDTLQFIRLLKALRLLNPAKVVLHLRDNSLDGLFLPVIGYDEIVVGRKATAPVTDFYCNLMSLPQRLQLRENNIPGAVSLNLDLEKKLVWRQRLMGYMGIKVGLAWAGNPGHSNDHNRSMPLTALAPLFRLQGMSWFSLQKGPRSSDIALSGFPIVDWSDSLHAYSDTLALMSELDLIVSVDTSVAHAAGTIGKPTYVMLPFAPDFRWMQGRMDSPWYPTVRLLRQKRIQDWSAPVEALVSALRGRLGGDGRG